MNNAVKDEVEKMKITYVKCMYRSTYASCYVYSIDSTVRRSVYSLYVYPTSTAYLRLGSDILAIDLPTVLNILHVSMDCT